MKRFSLFLLVIITLLAVKYDITEGTLPASKNIVINQNDQQVVDIPFFEHKINRGETLISVVEANLEGPIPVSMEKLINDFHSLNNDVKPEEMREGIIYKFPNYTAR